MSSKVMRNHRRPARKAAGLKELDALYADLLHHYYEEVDEVRAERIGRKLEKALASRPDFAASIRGEEVRSLLAELRGDLDNAIRSREAEIRKILELHTLTVNTPHWKYVARQYDFSDVSDRLDLLAILYNLHGDPQRAIAILKESQQFCAAHRIPFDGQDVLDEIERDERK
jgi:hypothetical protein